MIETGFGKEFSEPPNVTVSAARTHCEACKEPLDPNVMHKCHGNKHYEPPVFSSTEVTEVCPKCGSFPILVEHETFQGKHFVVVCRVDTCRTYLYPEVQSKSDAISCWNANAVKPYDPAMWPKWLADMPGDEPEISFDVPESWAKAKIHPDLTNYQGACPVEHVDGEVCASCENTGTIPPTKEGAQ